MIKEDDDRSTFLIALYNQLMNDINRHIVVVWQAVGVLFAAFAALSLVEKKTISIDLGITLIVMVSAWVIAHVYDASYWYNRNLAMIANIERQFLRKSDLRDIHHYFGNHRKPEPIEHLKIQLWLAVAVAVAVLLFHFFTYVLPTVSLSAPINWSATLPYLTFLGLLGIWWRSRKRARNNYLDFIKISPGIDVDASHLPKDRGHPTLES